MSDDDNDGNGGSGGSGGTKIQALSAQVQNGSIASSSHNATVSSAGK